MTINERFEIIIKDLFAGNKRAFAMHVNVSPTVVENVVGSRKGKPSFDFLNKVCANANISPSWLLTGEGPMLVEESNARLAGLLPDRSESMPVKYVPVSAHASFIENIDSSGPLDFINVFPAAHEREDADNLYVFDVSGDSMSPTIQDGAQILTRRIPRKHWHYAEGVVVAVYGEFVVVKRILKNGLASDNRLLLGSDNPRYSSMEIQEADLRGLFKAIRIISSKIY